MKKVFYGKFSFVIHYFYFVIDMAKYFRYSKNALFLFSHSGFSIESK